MKRRGGLGWVPAWIARGAQTKEEMFWRDLPLNGLKVYDVGAFHGILTLFFASHAAQVIAYEPNNANRARLLENIGLNHIANVRVRKFGIGFQHGSGTLHYTPGMAGGGTLGAALDPALDAILNPASVAPISQQVEITTLDRDIATCGLPAPDLIKIDIEGWELEALRGARATLDAHHPALFLEMHGETMREKKRKVAEIVAFLCDAGYLSILHVETGLAIGAANADVAAEGHLYCRYTPK